MAMIAGSEGGGYGSGWSGYRPAARSPWQQYYSQPTSSYGSWADGGGGGGGGGRAPWAGSIGWGAIPWADYASTPWANVPKGRGKEAMQWYNTMLPWQQAQAQAQQWGTEFDWRKTSDLWRQAFEEGQFGWQKEGDVWSRGFQESQLGQQKELEIARQQTEREAAAMGAYGRWRKPTARWA